MNLAVLSADVPKASRQFEPHGHKALIGVATGLRSVSQRASATLPIMVADDMHELEMLRRYEPILRMTEGELFFPADVGDYVAGCELYQRGPDDQPERLVAKGDLTLDLLCKLSSNHPRPGQFLRFVDEPFSRVQVAKWRLRSDRSRFDNASRLARVGVLTRVVDALNRASLLVRGKVATGTQAAAETEYREQMRPEHHPYYGRVVRSAGYIVLQYWFFYAFNDWRSRVYGVNDHEADWEQVTIYLAEQSDGPPQPAWVVFSAHDEVGDDLRRRWDDPDLTLVGDHPVVHPGLGSHSGAYLAGEYLTTFEGRAFHRLIKLFRAINRALLPWTRGRPQAGVGIPYIDYSRGDGVSIGPGQQREWHPMLVDETTPWLLHYRGLWGNDTQDPLGGEQGPAGPRYERSAAVRASWGDPVGWSGLRKIAPNPEAADLMQRAHLAELDDEISALESQITARQTAIRAEAASGETVSAVAEGELLGLTTAQVRLRDEHITLEHRLGQPPPDTGPHDHLRHRRLPIPDEERARRRVLSIWAAISTPLVLLWLILLVLPLGASLAGLSVGALLVILTVEAVARRQLARFLIAVVVVAVLVAAGLALAVALLVDWRRSLTVLLATSAAILLVVNLAELRRD